jgi:hypothetical protein
MQVTAIWAPLVEQQQQGFPQSLIKNSISQSLALKHEKQVTCLSKRGKNKAEQTKLQINSEGIQSAHQTESFV